MDNLDITDFKERGIELKKAITQAVKDTQLLIVKPYPSFITMTVEQYRDLQDDPDLKTMYQSDNHMYVTKYNIMEVVVKET